MSDNSPFGLDQWLTFLQEKKFPVHAGNLTRLKHQIKTPDETLDRLQNNISSEPFLAFVIISEANRVVQNKRTDIKTPNHAASMVGMNGLSKLMGKLLSCEFSKKNSAHQNFLRQVQISYEAASIARRWAIEKKTNNYEDIFWITFFRDAIRWMMWFYAEPQMSAMVALLKKGESTKLAEEKTIGCRLDELTVKLFQLWQIPHVIIDSFLTDHIPNPKELKLLASLAPDPDQIPGYTEDKRLTILANSQLLLAFCATKVAHDANNRSWASPTLTMYYQVIACVLHCKQGRVTQATHLATVEAANLYAHSDKVPIACQLVSPSLYIEKQASNTIKPRKALSPIDQLKQLAATTLTDKKPLLKGLLKTTRSLIPNTQHALILQYTLKTKKLQPIMQFGYDIDVLKTINWNTPSTIVDRLITKRSAVNLPSGKLKTAAKNLPKSAQQIVDDSGHLMLASCPKDNGDCFIFWLDTRETFNQQDFDHYKSMLLIISKALMKP